MDRRKFIYTGVAGIAAASFSPYGTGSIIPLSNNKSREVPGNIGETLNPDILATPCLMNMGFHYTTQFSVRNRVNVLGLVDQSTEEWMQWYYRMHEQEPLQKMADAGYRIIEIHFMHGFGIKGEKVEYDLTKKMVANAHKAGMSVMGYLQFFSVQKELFFYENPWAKDCLQVDATGAVHLYRYDRPALCFSHKKVKDYYLKAAEIGISYCDLDGIRLDNDYYRGCFCSKCREEFREYLTTKFSQGEARRIFGFEKLDAMDFVPGDMTVLSEIKDQLYAEMVKFRMLQRQKMMTLLHEKIISIKPYGILGGNPAICRRPHDSMTHNLYNPDLGKTHQLVCVENSLFPGITGRSIRHQVKAYKVGQANGFKVFQSSHLYAKDGKTRWPENKEECALNLCEALAFGGHVPCTTWGIRMDGENKCLYERPHFLAALTPLKNFLEKNEDIYRNAKSAAEIGIYLNRETHICDIPAYWYSLQGMMQLFLQNKIPFRFVDTDEDEKLSGLKLLIIANVRLVSDSQFERIKRFAGTNKVILTGDSCRYDDYFILRDPKSWNDLLSNKNVIHLKDMPERIKPEEVGFHGTNYYVIPNPPAGDRFLKELLALDNLPAKLNAIPFVAIDISENDRGEVFVHILNYDNTNPQDVEIEFSKITKTETISPETLGFASSEIIEKNGKTIARLKDLHTYAVVKITGT